MWGQSGFKVWRGEEVYRLGESQQSDLFLVSTQEAQGGVATFFHPLCSYHKKKIKLFKKNLIDLLG